MSETDPEIQYVPGAPNHYKPDYDVIVLDSELREFPTAHDVIRDHELGHANADTTTEHLMLELEADYRRHISTDSEARAVRRYLRRESPGGSNLGIGFVNSVRPLWGVLMFLAGGVYRNLQSLYQRIRGGGSR